MRKIIVDIDNTLWDLAPVFYEKIRAACPDIPNPTHWRIWDFWKTYIPDQKLYGILQEIHSRQDLFEPYDDSESFLKTLREAGFYIIIASHREKATFDATMRWLEKHDLAYDEIHLSYDKTVLFDESWAIIDDSPGTLDKAREAGIVRAGLRNPWNEDKEHPLFDNLMEVLAYLKTQCGGQNI